MPTAWMMTLNEQLSESPGRCKCSFPKCFSRHPKADALKTRNVVTHKIISAVVNLLAICAWYQSMHILFLASVELVLVTASFKAAAESVNFLVLCSLTGVF